MLRAYSALWRQGIVWQHQVDALLILSISHSTFGAIEERVVGCSIAGLVFAGAAKLFIGNVERRYSLPMTLAQRLLRVVTGLHMVGLTHRSCCFLRLGRCVVSRRLLAFCRKGLLAGVMLTSS